MADTVMVSSAGEAAISGVSLVDMINNLVFTIFAGLATGGAVVTSQAIGAVAILFLAGRINGPARITLKSVLSFDSLMAGKILTIGTPSAFENSVFQLGRVLVVSIISAFGTVHISANAVANSLDSIGCIFGQAISLAIITVVGKCVGALDIAAAKSYTKKLSAIAYVAITNGLIIIFLNPLLSLFSLSPETNRLSWILVMIHAGFAIFMWPASFVLPNALRAANDVRFTMVISIASMIVWRISFSLVLCSHMGLAP